jgi:hypothetical protein
VNKIQKSFINLVEILINNKVKDKKKVKFSEVIDIPENQTIKKQKVNKKDYKIVYPNIPQHVRQNIDIPKIIIQQSNDDFGFFVYFE